MDNGYPKLAEKLSRQVLTARFRQNISTESSLNALSSTGITAFSLLTLGQVSITGLNPNLLAYGINTATTVNQLIKLLALSIKLGLSR